MADENNGVAYFLVGLGVGVALGMLFAPKSGEETRELLKTRANEGKDYLKTRAEEGREYAKRRGDELRESASEILDKTKETIARQKEQLASAVEAGRQAYRDTLNES
jgi:gas vesicle protein